MQETPVRSLIYSTPPSQIYMVCSSHAHTPALSQLGSAVLPFNLMLRYDTSPAGCLITSLHRLKIKTLVFCEQININKKLHYKDVIIVLREKNK